MAQTNNGLVERFDRMAVQRNQIFLKLLALPPENLTMAPEGSWNSLEILQHLCLSESGVLKLLQKQVLKPASDFHTAKFKNIYRSLALNLTLLSTLRFKAPAAVSHFEPPMEIIELKRAWQKFETETKALLQNFPESHKCKVIFRHPRAGWITIKGTLDFLRLHQLHHIRQIRERAGLNKIKS